MSLYLVRHAKAGERRSWSGDDRERPLSAKGWRQSKELAQRLSAHQVTHLVSSPYLRCIQTLEPLAEATGLSVDVDDRLCEGESFSGVLDLLDELPDGGVLSSHGDIIPETIDALVRRGLEVRSAPDWRKSSVWVIERNDKGRYTRARVWPPPVS
jgi:8-oxo-dGTP diphosphatase